MENQYASVRSSCIEWGYYSVIKKILHNLVFRVEVESAFNVASFIFVRISAIDYFEGRDVIVELSPHQHG